MKTIFKILIIILFSSYSACSQSVEVKLHGSWILDSDYEFPDVIIFRSDNKYFVYNSNSVSTESLGLKENLKSDDILIDGAYSSMTEKGSWNFIPSTKELILERRNILEDWTDFSEAYGESNELRFHLKQITDNMLEICFKKKDKKYCDKYKRYWTLITNDDKKVTYKEITEEYVDIGSQTKEILLSGYETVLKLTYNFNKKTNQLIIIDNRGKELFSKNMINTNEKITEEIPLQGVTKLVFKVTSYEENSKWNLKVEIK